MLKSLDPWGAITGFVTLPGVQAIVLIVAALATAGSVIVALVISTKAERRQDTRDRTESTANLERRAERQAVLVKVAKGGEITGAFMGPQVGYQVEVSNLSELPVFDLAARLRGTIDGDASEGGPPSRPVLFGKQQMLETALTAIIGADVVIAGADVMFTDAYGDRWSLHSDGTLVLIQARVIREKWQLTVSELSWWDRNVTYRWRFLAQRAPSLRRADLESRRGRRR